MLHPHRKSLVSSQRLLPLQQESVWRAVQKKNATIGDAMVTMQTVPRIMATAMAAGIMVIIMCTSVNLVAIEAVAKWTKERHRCLEKRKKFLCLPMM